jgi:hypothetical protein
VPFVEPVLGNQMTRISDATAMSSSNSRISHIYAKNQPWNADGSLLLLDWNYPGQLLNGTTYKFIKNVNQPSQSMWSHVLPSIAYGKDVNDVVACDLMEGTCSVHSSITRYSEISLGEGEGNLSNDDLWLAIVGKRTATQNDIAVLDMTTRSITATLNAGTTPINNCAMSQSGLYVVVQWNVEGTSRFKGIELFDRSLNFIHQLINHGGAHFDLCYDTSGNEVVVVTDINSSALLMIRLDNLATTTLLSSSLIGYNIHVSCRNTLRPGWAYISQFTGDPDIILPYSQDTFAVQLSTSAGGNSIVQRFGPEYHSTDTKPAPYESQAMSVPSPEGDRVLFASDWGNSAGEVYTFLSRAVW